MPGPYPGSNYGWSDPATIAAQQAAEKAAAKKAAAPKYIPRGQRVQTGPQPAANFAPNAANLDMVNKAYGNIGRASIGTNANQIDQGGQNYWMNQLNSGAISPQDFAANFAGAAQIAQPETANMYQNQALSQISGARPSGDAQQFYQPVYQSQYTNYARPSTQFDTSLYGVQPMNSPSVSAGMSRGNINNVIENFYSTNPLGANAAATDVLNFMRNSGVNREDFQAAAGKNNYDPQRQSPSNYSGGMGGGLTPELARTLMQRSMTGSGVPTSEFQKFGGYDTVKALYDKSGGDYSGQGSPYPQQQQQQQAQFNPYTNQYQTPFSYQQPQQQQMQTPFSYQQPMAQRTSSGPSQAIVGRSSQMRGTPSVMRRAEGGITSLLKKHE